MKRLSECGMFNPPSHAPFIAANTRAPVVVRHKPTSRSALNGFGPFATGSTCFDSPVVSDTPGYNLSNLSFYNTLRARRSPVA